VIFRVALIALLAVIVDKASLAQPKRDPEVREKADRKGDSPMKLYEQGKV
jgi:hypothetical protein